MFSAAKDYLRTAERLDAAADGIRRGATDLADSWHGTAADESQQHLRQYYASARSLAAASRSSAAALNYAATALGAAQAQVFFLPGGAFPSLDPTSLQSLVYQKVLADLNAAYRDATTLAPTQIAVCLPRSGAGSVDERLPIWEDSGPTNWEGHGRTVADSAGMDGAATHNSTGVEGPDGNGHLQFLAPSLPSNPSNSMLRHRQRDSNNSDREVNLSQGRVLPSEPIRRTELPVSWMTPYDPGSSLAGVDGAGGWLVSDGSGEGLRSLNPVEQDLRSKLGGGSTTVRSAPIRAAETANSLGSILPGGGARRDDER